MDIKFSRVIERDVDLLLAEELASTAEFFGWFLGRIGLHGDMALESVSHSVSTSSGESDLEILAAHKGETYAVLVEDKIGAAFQPRQAERYRTRGEGYVRKGKCDAFKTVLIAPLKYLGDPPENRGFDTFLPYEDVAQWFQARLALGPRAAYKRNLLETAIQRGESGWVMVPDANATRFWMRYWELTKILAPELNMKKPGSKPATSAFIHFRPSHLPRGATLLHKVPYGHVDIQFAGQARNVEKLAGRYADYLQPGMRVCSAGKSGVIRLEVPDIDVAAPFGEIEGAVREAIWAARHLSLWFSSASK